MTENDDVQPEPAPDEPELRLDRARKDAATRVGQAQDQILGTIGTDFSAKVARLGQIDPVVAKKFTVLAQATKAGGQLVKISEDFEAKIPKFDFVKPAMPDWASAMPTYEAIEIPEIPKFDDTAQGRAAARAAQAAEQTAELLEVLVDNALANEARAAEMLQLSQIAAGGAASAEAREITMLTWTRAGVVLAAIAAVASIIAIVLA